MGSRDEHHGIMDEVSRRVREEGRAYVTNWEFMLLKAALREKVNEFVPSITEWNGKPIEIIGPAPVVSPKKLYIRRLED